MIILDGTDSSVISVEGNRVKPIIYVVTVTVTGTAVPTDDPDTALNHLWLEAECRLPTSGIRIIDTLKGPGNVRPGSIRNLLAVKFMTVTV